MYQLSKHLIIALKKNWAPHDATF